MSRPAKTKLPALGLYSPLTMLKNVVFPAPLGPIRLTIALSGMSKSTALTATRPPKTLVIPLASRMLGVAASLLSSGTGQPRYVIVLLTLAQLLLALAVRDYAFGSQEHHHHQQDTEEEEVVLGDVRVREQGATEGIADIVHPHVHLRQQVEVDPLHKYSAQNHAVDVPHSAKDDHAQNENGDVEREARRENALYKRPVECSRQPPEDSPQGVRPELRRHKVYPHRRRRRLVLAHRDPGPTEPRIPEANVHEDGDQHQHQAVVVPGVEVQGAELLPGSRGHERYTG